MTPGWVVVETNGGVHVLPYDGRGFADHHATRSCWCRPESVREGPLDEPIWSHNQPDWPGARKGLVQ